MEWKEEYSVKVPSIDNQHKRLFALMGEVKQLKDKESEDVKPVLKELLDYTLKHFIYEENLMEEYGFAELEDHRIAHDKLTGQVMDLKHKVDNNEHIELESLLDFLNDWLVNHILKTDMKYSELLLQKKVP